MGAMLKQTKKISNNTVIKRDINFLAVNADPVQNLGLIRNAPDELIKTICNAAYNLSHGSIHLIPKQKTLFKEYKSPITKLVQPEPAIKQNRRALVQHIVGLF